MCASFRTTFTARYNVMHSATSFDQHSTSRCQTYVATSHTEHGPSRWSFFCLLDRAAPSEVMTKLPDVWFKLSQRKKKSIACNPTPSMAGHPPRGCVHEESKKSILDSTTSSANYAFLLPSPIFLPKHYSTCAFSVSSDFPSQPPPASFLPKRLPRFDSRMPLHTLTQNLSQPIFN